MSHTAKHVIFSGRVQGVGFRFTAHSTAIQFGLVGFVRNLPDETVDMVVQEGRYVTRDLHPPQPVGTTEMADRIIHFLQ